MTDFLQHAYVFIWGILAVLMFFTGRRQGAYAYLLSLFFVFMTVWYALGSFGGMDMFNGVLRYVFIGVLLVFLSVFILIYLRSRKLDKPIFKHESKPDDKDKSQK